MPMSWRCVEQVQRGVKESGIGGENLFRGEKVFAE
jgi:hypothetical protein